MTKLLDQAVAKMRELPAEVQDDIALVMLTLANENEEIYELSPEERRSLEVSLAQADRGEFATDEEVEAVWAKYRR